MWLKMVVLSHDRKRQTGSQRNWMKVVRVDCEWVDWYYINCRRYRDPLAESIHSHGDVEGRKQ